MNLKHKLLFFSASSIFFSLMVVELIVYRVIMVNFQDIENQRVERNIRRVSAIIDDRLSQLSLKLTDWTNWDDTYKFMSDENIEYQISNLPVNAFEGIGVDQTLFINKNEEIIWTVDVLKNLSSKEVDLSNEMNQYFASGSALLKIDKEIGLNQGILKTKEGLILFVVREVFHSGGEGESNGKMVFGKYLDKEILNSMKDLTQFEAQIYFWDDPKIPADYLSIKNGYRNGEKELVKILDDQTISGYQVIEDVYGKEQAIIRSDINRDIVLRGKSSMILLIYLLIFTGILTVIINYLLVSRLILKKILLAIRDVGNLGRPGFEFKRLEAGHGVDEVDKLRVGINEMIDSLEEEKQKGESLLDLINAVVVRLNAKGEVSMINKYGLKKLGYSEEEVLGKNWLDNFLSPESREKISGVVGALLKEEIEENKEVENEILTKDGKRLLISWHNTVIKDIEGKVTSILSVGDDITQKREEEEKKERYSQELERLNRVMVGRELKMVELKKEINNLKNKK